MTRRTVVTVAALLLIGSITFAGDVVAVKVAATGEPAPAWAVSELKWLDALSKCYHVFLDRLVEGKMDLPKCRQLTENGGCDDDWAEGVAPWDRYCLLRADERIQKAYVKFWPAIFQERRMPKTNAFWNTGGFDPEHTSELFQLLWGSIDLDPTNEKFIADNKRVIDFVLDEFYDPKLSLMKNTHAYRQRKAQGLGDTIENTMWLIGGFHAYLTTGDPKYRKFCMDYGSSWNELAAANGGMLPYYVPPNGRKLGETWWKSPGRSSFGYQKWGITCGARCSNALPTMLCMLDRGNLKHVSGLAGTVEHLFARGQDGLPAGMHDDKTGMVRGAKGNWAVPRLIDHVYVHTWDAKLLERMKAYAAAAAKAGKAGGAEAGHLTFHEFTYLHTKDIDWLADLFAKQAERRAGTITNKLKRGNGLRVGDDIRGKYHISRWGLEFLDGCFWGTWDSGRCGVPVPASIRYFTADGRPGMPLDIAAIVADVTKDKLVVLLHNRAKVETALQLVAGFYGQHKFTTVTVGDGKATAVGDRRVQLVLAAGATAKVVLGLQRFAYTPTLEPLKPAK